MGENGMSEVVGYFMETDIYFQGEKQPPRKTPLSAISGNLDDYSDDDDIQVLSVEGNWYTIKKKDLIPKQEEQKG